MIGIKQVDELLINLLSSGKQFYHTELYTIKLIDIDKPITLTPLDLDVTVDGVVYKSAPISRSSITETLGIVVDDLSVEWNLKQTDHIFGSDLPIIQSMRYGAFDGASLTIDKIFSPNPWSYNMGSLSSRYMLKDRFIGLIDVERAGMVSASLKITSYIKLLNTKLPRNLFSPNCTRTFYASDCGVSRTALTKSGLVLSGDVSSILTSLPFNNDYYNMGVITFLSGRNIGIRRSVRTSRDGRISVLLPLPYQPVSGDDFIVYPGCSKTRESCSSYGNSINFRGCPFIPVPETVLGG